MKALSKRERKKKVKEGASDSWVYSSSSSIGTATLVGFGLLNYR